MEEIKPMSWEKDLVSTIMIPCVAIGIIVFFLVIQLLKNTWDMLKKEREQELRRKNQNKKK